MAFAVDANSSLYWSRDIRVAVLEVEVDARGAVTELPENAEGVTNACAETPMVAARTSFMVTKGFGCGEEEERERETGLCVGITCAQMLSGRGGEGLPPLPSSLVSR